MAASKGSTPAPPRGERAEVLLALERGEVLLAAMRGEAVLEPTRGEEILAASNEELSGGA